MTELRGGFYRIHAVGANNSLTGVDPTRPVTLPVRIDADVIIWRIKPQPEPGYYRLSLEPFPYTGVDDDRVIVTFDEEQDVNWLIKDHKELGGFTIALKSFWPTPVWTVVDGEIKIRLYELFPGKNQLFTFEPLDE